MEHKTVTTDEMLDRIRRNICTFDAIYYLAFFTLLIGVIVAGKVCVDHERPPISAEDQLRERAGLAPERGFREQFCDQKNRYTLNFGVLFLVMACIKKFFGQKSRRG